MVCKLWRPVRGFAKVAGKQIITQTSKTFSAGWGVGLGRTPGDTVDLAGQRTQAQPSAGLTGAAGLGASEGPGVERKVSSAPTEQISASGERS